VLLTESPIILLSICSSVCVLSNITWPEICVLNKLIEFNTGGLKILEKFGVLVFFRLMSLVWW